MPGAEVFNRFAERYNSWVERHPGIYAAELEALKALCPKSLTGVEIGVGSCRVALPLGIGLGVDSARNVL